MKEIFSLILFIIYVLPLDFLILRNYHSCMNTFILELPELFQLHELCVSLPQFLQVCSQLLT